jgi:twitching motility protein PilU
MFKSGDIDLDEALRHADSASNLSWMINNAQTVDEQERDKKIVVEQKKNDADPMMDFDISLH